MKLFAVQIDEEPHGLVFFKERAPWLAFAKAWRRTHGSSPYTYIESRIQPDEITEYSERAPGAFRLI